MFLTPLSRISSLPWVVLAAAALAASCAGASAAPSATSATEQNAAQAIRSQPTRPSQPVDQSLDHFVPDGWVVFGRARADLDQDGRQDMVALVEHKQSGQRVDSYPLPRTRYVLIVVQGEPFARLAAMNAELLRTEHEFGMLGPTVELEASHGRFAITQSGGTSGHRWSYTLDFQHDRTRSAWYLAACSFDVTSFDVRGRPQTGTGEHSYPYTLKNDFGHYDRGEFEGFCPKL
ncbi:hypothetical protein FIV42_16095 [Persicimonas caeni]|uniref:VCBS repeat-containing protein n=1 Tax=Persicimonas caeni TaxID=2292766 RepID=A0A4Y6PW30_PERCE|nr:hypothetical protein [Persicimonas caeni]QDG52207.1 hypothetical protein FIV42_16095 [Persicimonas caeni]QED33429.1 hypothetical protein FRD00_16090 [Persicimonas caeni]